MERKTQEKKGITLISLVITIILLLLLATVAISLAVDSDGLFRKAGQAANTWNTSVADEEDSLKDLIGTLESISPTAVTLSTEIPEGWNEEAVAQVAKAGNRQVPIPEGFTASEVEGENTIEGGLVIYETTTPVTDSTGLTLYNQYVWIPVDEINDMVMCQVCGGSGHLTYDEEAETLLCDVHGAETKLAGKMYGGEWENTKQTVTEDGIYVIEAPMNFEQNNQTYDATSTNSEPNEQAQSYFTHMAKSVAKYKGFYVSRYEVGVNGNCIKGQVDFTVTNTSFIDILKSNIETTSPTYRQVIWGSQYDQVIKFIGTEAMFGHIDRSIDEGLNYVNYESVVQEVLKAGNNPLDKMKNIYDLEGNFIELTSQLVFRGRICFWSRWIVFWFLCPNSVSR